MPPVDANSIIDNRKMSEKIYCSGHLENIEILKDA